MSGLGPLTVRELKKWYRNPVFFIVGLIQPFFWIALFGSAFDITKFALPGFDPGQLFLQGSPNYITFILGGVLTITSLFTAMFAGTNIIWDRRLGPLSRFLSSPIRRSSIVFSKILSATVRILVQVFILIVAALAIPNGLVFQNGFTLFDALVIVVAVTLVAFSFSSIFSIIAIRMTRMETIFGIVNMVNLPLMFASYTLFPPALMAGWLSDIAKWNPVSWSAVSIRTVILNGSLTAAQMHTVMLNLAGLAALALGLILITYFLSEAEIRE